MGNELERRALLLLYGTKEQLKTMENKKQYDNTNSGALFPNDNKTKDTQPDWSGPLNFEGVELRLAGWVRERQSGGTFISVKVERMEDTGAVRKKRGNFDNEEIPF